MPSPEPEPSQRPLRLVVRGDSQGNHLGEGRVDVRDPRLWATILVEELAAKGIAAETRNASTAGMRIREGLHAHRTDPLVREAFDWADVVLISLAINDFWPVARPQAVADWMDRARPLVLRRAMRKGYNKVRPKALEWTRGRIRPTPPAKARADLLTWVRELQANGQQVGLLTPLPVRSPINPLLDGNTDEACQAVVDVAREAGVPVVDCRELFPPIEWEKISLDHLHASPEGHALVARTVADALDAAGMLDPRAAEFPAPVDTGRVLLRGDRRGALAHPAIAEAVGAPARNALVEGYSLHDDVRWVVLDPLIREAVEGADVTVLAPSAGTPGARPSAWDRERLDTVVFEFLERGRLVLVDDGGPWSSSVRAVAAARDVPVVAPRPDAVAEAARAGGAPPAG